MVKTKSGLQCESDVCEVTAGSLVRVQLGEPNKKNPNCSDSSDFFVFLEIIVRFYYTVYKNCGRLFYYLMKCQFLVLYYLQEIVLYFDKILYIVYFRIFVPNY